VSAGSVCYIFAVLVGSVCYIFGVSAGSLCYIFAVSAGSVCYIFTVSAGSVCYIFAVSAGSVNSFYDFDNVCGLCISLDGVVQQYVLPSLYCDAQDISHLSPWVVKCVSFFLSLM
jgi:hypothetical protein